jgi:FixJ family two-component response regulator
MSGTALIAVVDDEESVRKALGRLLRAAGFDVETFSAGAEFLRWVERHRPHCVVLDLRMPQVSGFDVQRALVQAGANLPVVIITGDDFPEGRARALEHGAKAYLRKPVDEATLLDAIRRAIAGSGA